VSTKDRTGPIIVDWLNQQGITTPAPVVVADGPDVVAALSAAVSETST
jgi:molybdopterin biosynthesis enzyme MoaB